MTRFVIYESNSYDLLRTWYSLSYQPIDCLEILKSKARMNHAMSMTVDPFAIHQMVLVMDEVKGTVL